MPEKLSYVELTEKLEAKNQYIEELKQRLASVENQLRLITNNAKDIIFRYSIIDEKIEFINQATYKVLGYAPDEFYRHPKLFIELILDEWKSDFLKYWDKALNNRYVKPFDYQLITKQGDVVWVYQTSNTIVDIKGNPVAIEGSITDITYRKQAELNLKRKNIEYLSLNEEYLETNEELRNSNKELVQKNEKLRQNEIRFRSLFENMSNNVAILEAIDNGEKFIFKNFNSAAEKLEGVNREDIIGKEVEQVFPSVEKFKLTEAFKRVWNTGVSEHQPIIVTDDSGNLLSWTENFVYKLPSNELVVIYDDITERKKAEIDLIKTKERYRIATEETKVAVWERDLKSGVGHADPVLFDILGYPVPNMVDSFSIWREYIEPEDLLKITTANQELIDGKIKEINIKFRATHRDGSIRWFLDKGVALRDENGKAMRLIGTILDITQQQKIEEELILSREKAVEADNLKSTFLANMSHEIRTPMNGILGFSELLKSDDSGPEERANYIDIIRQSGKQLMNIINDILDISKIEVGQIQINEENTSVNHILDELLVLFKPDAVDKGIELRLHKELEDYESVIRTDSVRLRQILSNLINNAIKFTKKGYVEFGYILVPECDEQTKNKIPCIQFFVSDTGIGIPKNKREIIFDRFRQSDESHTRKFGGTGLGLAISKGFVELLGGKIWHESEENKGSTFYFTIPYKVGEHDKIQRIEEKFAEQYHWDKYKVLIVEDDDVSFRYMSKVLEKTGIDIVRAVTGLEAIDLCKANSGFNLVLMDIQLPGINGYEATKRIRELNPDIPVIAQTAHALAEDRKKSIDVGCNDFITKPIKRNVLLRKIEKYLNS
jgi:PAS domain S-box-containing protein